MVCNLVLRVKDSMLSLTTINKNLTLTCRNLNSILIAAFLASVSITPPVYSQSVTIGLPADENATSCLPFGCAAERYQQVYNKNLFTQPLLINQISFFGSGFVNTATYTLRLSTTNKDVNSLDVIDLSNNVGANNSLFFQGDLGGFLTGDLPEASELKITGSDFFYDPSEGNLLLDLFIMDGVNFGESYFASRNGTFGNDSSRAYSPSSGIDSDAGYRSFGLVTEFKTISTRVPESSSTFGLLAFSALAACSVLKHRQ